MDQQPYRMALEQLKRELSASLAEAGDAAPVEPDRAIGRLTRQDAMQAQQMALELRRRSRQRLQMIDRALERFDSGEYGECTRCGAPISAARLNVKPETPICVDCASGAR